MIMMHGYCSWNIINDFFKCLRFFKGFLNAILRILSHLQEHFKKTHTHTHSLDCFFFFSKNHGKSVSFNHLFLQFNSKIVDFIFANSSYLKQFVEFYFVKKNSAKIYIILNIYSVKIYSVKAIQRS